MSLTNVWVQTQSDGLVRADQVVGVDAHTTPALSGKPSRWLLDVVLAGPLGSGTRDGWTVTMAHRTLVQTAEDPGDAPAALVRLLAQLDLVNAAGIVTATHADARDDDGPGRPGPAGDVVAGGGRVRLRFVPFAGPEPGHHTGAEYL